MVYGAFSRLNVTPQRFDIHHTFLNASPDGNFYLQFRDLLNLYVCIANSERLNVAPYYHDEIPDQLDHKLYVIIHKNTF